ncbi:MAG: glucosaminidase domain-containing protein [Gammaproteobacteria bacterium]|nr:glucosaminidase domain-containing protein [Gammaproteobacteria bacterium]
MKWIEHAIIPITLLMVITVVAYARLQDTEEATPIMDVPSTIPDFGSYKNISRKKQDFFEYLLPMVRNANSRVMADRERLQAIDGKLEQDDQLTSSESEFVRDIARRHKVKLGEPIDGSDLDELLVKVDIVPASLILAQAANESAWGTSRFARHAYNFFGIWCFTPGCGIPPRYRDEGLTHEVKRFESVQASARSLPAYDQFQRRLSRAAPDSRRLAGPEPANHGSTTRGRVAPLLRARRRLRRGDPGDDRLQRSR